MRMLRKNTLLLTVISPGKEEPVKDGEFYTGEYHDIDNVFEVRACLLPKNNDSEQQPFAKDLDYKYLAVITLYQVARAISGDIGNKAKVREYVPVGARVKVEGEISYPEMEIRGVIFTRSNMQIALSPVSTSL